MIITPQFIFIHLHKTGGQFIGRAILDFIPGARQYGYHYPLSMLPAEHQHKPVVGFVRNPWAWYVSWYAFNQTRPTVNPLYVVMSGQGQYDFQQTVRHLLSFGANDEASQQRLAQLSKILPNSIEGNRGIGLTKMCLATAEGSFYQWQFQRMFETEKNDVSIYWGKTESLREDFLAIMEQLNVSLPSRMRDYILSADKLNRSEHSDYQTYYDIALRADVAQEEKKIIDQFHYQFDE